MSTLTINIPDQIDTRVADAFSGAYPGRPQGTSKAAWVKICVQRYIKDVVVGYERDQASVAAMAAAATAAETEISLT